MLESSLFDIMIVVVVLATAVLVQTAASPSTTITWPSANWEFRGNLFIQGTATDDSGVDHVELTFRNKDTNMYWNGESWQTSWIRYPVRISGSPTFTNWSEEIPASQLTHRGNYFARAWTRATNGNGDPIGNAQVNFSWNDRLQKVSNLVVSGQTSTSITITWTTDKDDRLKSFDFFVNGKWVDWTPNVDAVVYTFSGLKPETLYKLGVTAVGDPTNTYNNGVHYSPRQTLSASTTKSQSPISSNPPPAPINNNNPSVRPTNIIWEETFDTLDTSRWKLEHSTYGDGNNERQCYRPENVRVENGKLVLRAVHETYTCPNGSQRTVTSGMVRSIGLNIEPGQILEFRVKLTPADENNQGGLWPAVWASGWAGGGWPLGGEMDFIEVMTANNPRRSVYTIHYQGANNGRHEKMGREVFGQENFSNDWHTIRFHYGDSILEWYLDGVQVHRVDGAPTAQGWPTPFDQSTRELKINLALGGNPGPLDDAALGESGATFEVDYIRVFTTDDDENSNLLGSVAPAFCFSGISLCNVAGKGMVAMESLEIGDKVLVHNDKFEPVYSFGHRNKDLVGEFIRIKVDDSEHDAIELSSQHLIYCFKNEHAVPVPAGMIRVGDKILMFDDDKNNKATAVISIQRLNRKGVYAPFTLSGTIVVNGLVASTYTSFGADNTAAWNLGFMSLSYHWLSHTFQAWHRLLHYLGIATADTYNKEGISTWAAHPHQFVEWLHRLPKCLVGLIIIPLVVFFEIFSLVEMMVFASDGSPFALLMMIPLALAAIFFLIITTSAAHKIDH